MITIKSGLRIFSLMALMLACNNFNPADSLNEETIAKEQKVESTDKNESTEMSQLKNPSEESQACFSGYSGDYTDEGPFGYQDGVNESGLLTVIPVSFDDKCKYPAIVFGMGTGADTSVYQSFYQHLASYGFVVVVDPTKNGQASGESMRAALDWLYDKSEYSSLLSDMAGATGHSQGGGGAFASSMHSKVKAVVGLQPGQFLTDQNTTAAYCGLAGTNDMFGQFTNPSLLHYPLSEGVPKFMASYVGADHVASMIETSKGPGLYYKAVTTAWFRCYLTDDQNACELFDEDSCDNLPSADNWTECQGESLK